MKKYVALLRGINVGGNKKVPMARLRELFSELGFENPKTLLNSGNIVFGSKEKNEAKLVEKLETQMEKTFGFQVNVIVRTIQEIHYIIQTDPFKKTEIDKNIRLYVTFMPENPKNELKLPYVSTEKDFQILQKTEREIFSVLNIKTAKSVEAMAFLEKEFGKNITTRNWNTVKKIAEK